MSLTKSKIVLIGQAPSRYGDPSLPLCMNTAKKLSELAGISYLEYMESFDRMNVLDYWPGANEKGDKFPMVEARQRANALVESLAGRKAIFVGRATALAFKFTTGYFRWMPWRGFFASCMPHPSGVNRWWNEKKNAEAARRFLGSLGSLSV